MHIHTYRYMLYVNIYMYIHTKTHFKQSYAIWADNAPHKGCKLSHKNSNTPDMRNLH